MIAQAVLLVVVAAASGEPGVRYSRSWAVELRGTEADADRIAAKHGLFNHGSVRLPRREKEIERGWGRGGEGEQTDKFQPFFHFRLLT